MGNDYEWRLVKVRPVVAEEEAGGLETTEEEEEEERLVRTPEKNRFLRHRKLHREAGKT